MMQFAIGMLKVEAYTTLLLFETNQSLWSQVKSIY